MADAEKQGDRVVRVFGNIIDITERKQAEDEVRRFKTISDNAVYGKAIADLHGNLLYINRFFANIHGYEPEDLIGSHRSLFHNEQQLEAVERLNASMIQEGHFAPSTVWHCHKDGTEFPLLMSGILLRDDNGNPQYITASAVDITARKQIEQELISQKQYLETILESAADGFWVVTPDKKIINVNAAYCRMSGYSKAERVKRIMEKGSETFETKHRRKDGSLMDVEVSASRYDRSDGMCLVCFCRDITERKQYLKSRKQIEWMLSAKKDVGKDCLSEYGDYALGLFSSSWCQLMDLASRRRCRTDSNKEALRCGKWLCHDSCWGASMKAINSGEPADVECTGGLRLYAVPIRAKGEVIGAINFGYGNPPDGTLELQKLSDLYQIPIEELQKTSREHQVRPQFIIDYAKSRIEASATSIGLLVERKLAEEEIQKQLAEKEILLREVHHRVKNNIANIESLLSLQAGSTAHAEVKAALLDAISRVRSVRVLYDKILLSKDLDQISIKGYAEGLVDSLATVFYPERSVIIEKHIASFEIDARKAFTIGIILNELLTNVFKYAFGDRKDGLVSVSIDKVENAVTLIIQDNGRGFDEGALENESPGVGLTIVKMLVEQLGGTHSLSNDHGARSVVQFET